MKKAFKLVIAPILAVCLAGSLCLAACSNNNDDGNDDGNNPGTPTTYTFEAEDAQLWADESELLTTLSTTQYGEYVTDCVFDVQYNDAYSGGASVGYLAENNPTITFVINSDVAVSGAQISIKAASMDLELSSTSNSMGGIFGLAAATINEYKGADHDILKLNSSTVTLGGTLEGSDTVFKGIDSIADIMGAISSGTIGSLLSDLNFDNFGTLTATVDLKAGENIFVFTIENGAGLNFDYMQITTTATLTWTETDNSGFVNGTTSTVIPPDDDDDDENGGTTDEVVEESNYDNLVSLTADKAGMFNATGATKSSGSLETKLLKLEEQEGITGTDEDGEALTILDCASVGNFNAEGDKVVYQVLASADVDNVLMTVTAGCAELTTGSSGFLPIYLADYDATTHSILTVNGTSTTWEGTVKASSTSLDYTNSWGLLTATISLKAGINYIVFTCDGTAVNLGRVKLEYNNYDVDSTTTTTDNETGEETSTTVTTTVEPTVEQIDCTSDIIEITAADQSATLEIENGSFINATGKTDGLTDGLLKSETLSETTKDEETGESTTTYRDSASVGNFNTIGDTVVIAVYADEYIESVALNLTAGTAIYKMSLLGGLTFYLGDYVGSEHDILSVNGSSASLSGTITGSSDSLDYYNSFGTLTATISLKEGINYIVFTADTTAGINLDSITLTWTVASDDAEATT